ncbi:CPBP family intramembrane metalloprotease [Streptococcus sp. IMAU 99125]|uniref:CPBP family intramembrane metalloprotease n=1 Tax=Streptococcus humanilactis TaxID=2841061 RepID=A0ABS7DVH9_9STRE|nr:type II CAAX endopeptidase family protein [Streptococcus humanilactis]MBW7580162.1 CPBP family intramembrane metalloprotease [Streptococcus humanilactis]MBW7582023.1 CPBP family intramembrane metalloprotease [Streptococcus humanilactis]
MAIFNKCHALFLGFLVFAIVGAAGYSVNQGDYFQHQYTFIVVKSLLLCLSIGYARWFDMISFGVLSKKQLLLFIAIFLLSVLETLVYIHFFAISSGAGVQHLTEVSRGISLSLILTSSVFGPIQEELIFRGLLQGAVFDNSWLGLVLTSSLFSFMHGPSNVPSFIFYLLGGLLLGFAYKKSQNLWVSTLVHMFYNSWPLLTYL